MFRIGSIRRSSPSFLGTSASMASLLAKNAPRRDGALPTAPHIGRWTTGSVGKMQPLASPIADQATKPLLITISGLTPKNAGTHRTRSAILPGSIEPTYGSMPRARAGLIVYLAT